MNFSIDSGWLAVARLDIVMFNVTILLIGSTILLGTMTVEKVRSQDGREVLK